MLVDASTLTGIQYLNMLHGSLETTHVNLIIFTAVNRPGGVVDRVPASIVSTSQSVDIGFIPLVES